MIDETKVWIRKRKTKKGTSYHLRWICPNEHKWRSKGVGTDSKRATREAALLERELSQGTYQDIKRIAWTDFVDEYVGGIEGKENAAIAKRTLEDFGTAAAVTSPRRVTFGKIKAYVGELRRRGKSAATINKALRYVRGAMNIAVDLDYIGRSPYNKKLMQKTDKKPPRILTDDEQARILEQAAQLYGFRAWALVLTAIETGARRDELLFLDWQHVDFDRQRVHFTNTKSHADRFVPVDDRLCEVLQRLKVQTLQDGGPFIGMKRHLQDQWGKIIEAAEVTPKAVFHDTRRACAANLIRAGIDLPTVQRWLGHSSITTTITFYHWVSDDDLRAGLEKRAKAREVVG